jgi:hypothetical protein
MSKPGTDEGSLKEDIGFEDIIIVIKAAKDNTYIMGSLCQLVLYFCMMVIVPIGLCTVAMNLGVFFLFLLIAVLTVVATWVWWEIMVKTEIRRLKNL